MGKRFGCKLHKVHTDIFATLLVETSYMEQISHERLPERPMNDIQIYVRRSSLCDRSWRPWGGIEVCLFFFLTPAPDWGGWLTPCPGRFFPRKGTRLSFSDTDFWIESIYSGRRIKTFILIPQRNCTDLFLMYLFCNRERKCTYDIAIVYRVSQEECARLRESVP